MKRRLTQIGADSERRFFFIFRLFVLRESGLICVSVNHRFGILFYNYSLYAPQNLSSLS